MEVRGRCGWGERVACGSTGAPSRAVKGRDEEHGWEEDRLGMENGQR